MYEGECDKAAVMRVVAAAKVPVVLNGDRPLPAGDGGEPLPEGVSGLMIGRAFIRSLGARDDSRELLRRYAEASQAELFGDRPLLGRMKELVSYWKDLPQWRRRWGMVKVCSSAAEFFSVI